MKHIGQFLYDKLTIDKRYIEYCNKYLEYKKIDSNILNKLLNENRSIVSDIPGILKLILKI